MDFLTFLFMLIFPLNQSRWKFPHWNINSPECVLSVCQIVLQILNGSRDMSKKLEKNIQKFMTLQLELLTLIYILKDDWLPTHPIPNSQFHPVTLW